MFRGLVVGLALGLALGARADAGSPPADEPPMGLASWQIVESDSPSFRVLLPPNPERVESIRRTWIGRVRELSLEAEVEGGAFTLQVRELPRAARWLVTQSFIFEQVKDAFLMGGKRKELADDEITRDGYPGRLIRYEDPEREGWVGDALIIIADDLLYFLVAARTRVAEPNLPIQAFFESFHVR